MTRTHTTCAGCNRPRALDLFSGEGGAGEGYRRAGFCVSAVDNDRARLRNYYLDCDGAAAHYADALEFLAAGVDAYAFVHASPPCTGYSRGTVALPGRLDRYDRLIAATRDLLVASGVPYVIENVEGAKNELRTPLTLCWTMFRLPGSVTDDDGTPLWMRRHRLFESNLPLMGAGGCFHPAVELQCAGAYGGARRDKIEARTVRHGGYVPAVPVMRELLGAPWMSEKGCQLSIPPAYTQHLGEQVLDHLQAVAA